MFEDDELNIKILNCLTRTWEPKITTIKESKDLGTMTMEALIDKCLAYEHELIQQSHAEETKKKVKGIAFKVNSSKEDGKESSNSDGPKSNVIGNYNQNSGGKSSGNGNEKSNSNRFYKSPRPDAAHGKCA